MRYTCALSENVSSTVQRLPVLRRESFVPSIAPHDHAREYDDQQDDDACKETHDNIGVTREAIQIDRGRRCCTRAARHARG